MSIDFTPGVPAVEGRADLQLLHLDKFAVKYVKPLINAYAIKLKQSDGTDLHRLFFLNEGLTFLGRKILKTVYAKAIEKIMERFPTVEAIRGLENNIAAIEVLDMLIESYFYSEAHKELEREKSGYDSLMKGFVQKNNTSGLYQRVTLDILNRAKETGNELSLVFCDLDYFKGVNDYGQHVGDAALTHLAKVINENLRGPTTSIRWGGEEIVLLFENCNTEKACEAALRINQALNKTPLHLIAEVKDEEKQEVGTIFPLEVSRYEELEAQAIYMMKRRGLESTLNDPRNLVSSKKVRLLKIPLSASIGVVNVNPHQVSAIDAAFVEANALERAAKHNGRNQVWFYNEETMQQYQNNPSAE